MVALALGGVRKPMFGIPTTRAAELSRPDYPRELAEFARLEYPLEDVRTLFRQVLAAQEKSRTTSRRWFHWFCFSGVAKEVTPAKA